MELNAYRQFYSLFWGYTHQLGHETSIQARDTLVANDFFEAVPAVAIHQFTNVSTGTLVLHPGFDQIDGVNGRSTASTGNGAQSESVS